MRPSHWLYTIPLRLRSLFRKTSVGVLAGAVAAVVPLLAAMGPDSGWQNDRMPVAWLGQRPPGPVPQVFGPGVVSTPGHEVNPAFTPDGKEFFFSVFRGGQGYTIMTMRQGRDGWESPRPAPFGSAYSEVDAFVTPDGSELYFISKRPLTAEGLREGGYKIWSARQTKDGWGEPRPLSPRVNFGRRQLFPTLTRQGVLYFSSNGDGTGGSDLFRARPFDGDYLVPERLSSAVNSSHDETDALIAPDESWIIFTSVDRPDGYGGGDLYISFRRPDGAWSLARNMGPGVNTASSEFTPALSPDGRFFFFASGRGGSDDIYWMDATIIDSLRPSTANPEPYLGQPHPGRTPQLFGAGVVSTPAIELNAAFAPGGVELFFSEWRSGRNTLVTLQRAADGSWKRVVAAFSGAYSDVDPYFDQSGRRLYFSSTRPPGGTGEAVDSDLWCVERTGEGKWGNPMRVEGPSVRGPDDYYTSITRDGTLYFSRFAYHGAPGDIYASKSSGGRFLPAELVGPPVSGAHNDHDPFVAPDGSYLIFTSNRPGGHGRADLYVSFREPGGSWSEPVNLGPEINTAAYEYSPMLSPDGAFLFFTRNPGGNGDIYWVDAAVIAARGGAGRKDGSGR